MRWSRLIAVTAAAAIAGIVLACSPESARATPPTLTLEKTFVTGLYHPWDIGFAGDSMFFTERDGPISVRQADGDIVELENPADVYDQPPGEGGMMGLAVDPDFAANPATETNRYIYTCFSSNLDEVDMGPSDNRLVRWSVNADFTDITRDAEIVTGMPHNPDKNGRHSGCRPRFKPGTNPPALFVGTGDSATGSVPQDRQSLGGKVLRITRDGAPYPGNHGGKWDDRIFNIGHRNVQGIAFPATGRGYSVEHGTGRHDEVNKIKRGNFGWDPTFPSGPGYNQDAKMTDRAKFPNAIVAVWHSGPRTIAPSGATFLEGPQWENWDGRLALAVLDPDPDVGQHLRILKVRDDGTIAKARDKERFANENTRLRSVVQGPDGNLYIATDDRNAVPSSAIWKVTPS